MICHGHFVPTSTGIVYSVRPSRLRKSSSSQAAQPFSFPSQNNGPVSTTHTSSANSSTVVRQSREQSPRSIESWHVSYWSSGYPSRGRGSSCRSFVCFESFKSFRIQCRSTLQSRTVRNSRIHGFFHADEFHLSAIAGRARKYDCGLSLRKLQRCCRCVTSRLWKCTSSMGSSKSFGDAIFAFAVPVGFKNSSGAILQ